MVVVVKGEKRYGDVRSLTEEFLVAHDGVEELAAQLSESMTALQALLDRFEKAVKKQSKTLGSTEKAVHAGASTGSTGSVSTVNAAAATDANGTSAASTSEKNET